MSWDVVAKLLLGATLGWFQWQLWSPAKRRARETWSHKLDPSARQMLAAASITAAVFLWPPPEGKSNMTGILYQLLQSPDAASVYTPEDAYSAPTMTSPPGIGGESRDGQIWTPLAGG